MAKSNHSTALPIDAPVTALRTSPDIPSLRSPRTPIPVAPLAPDPYPVASLAPDRYRRAPLAPETMISCPTELD